MSGKAHLYSYQPTDASWHYVKGTSNNELSTADATSHSKLDQIITNTSSTSDSTAANQVTMIASLAEIESSVDSANDRMKVSLENDAVGLATSANQSTGNASLASIDGKITSCDTGSVTISSSVLPTGASSEAKQDDIITKLDEMNDGVNTLETFSTTALTFNNSSSKNTNNYSRYCVLLNSDQTDTALVIQASQNNTDWYHSEYYTTVNALVDPDGVSDSQNNYVTSGDCVAKYMRVRIYSPTAANVKLSFNLLH